MENHKLCIIVRHEYVCPARSDLDCTACVVSKQEEQQETSFKVPCCNMDCKVQLNCVKVGDCEDGPTG
jgi:hypothetical protein